MPRRSPALLAICALSLAALARCHDERAILAPQGEPASWSYVNDAWGGLAARESNLTATTVTLPLAHDLHPTRRVDSAICISAISGRVAAHHILVRLNRGICGQRPPITNYAVTIPRPRPGTYPVLYDDWKAGYPRIGEVRVPPFDQAPRSGVRDGASPTRSVRRPPPAHSGAVAGLTSRSS